MKRSMKLVTITLCAFLIITFIATSELGTNKALADVAHQSGENMVTTTSDGKTYSAPQTELIYLPVKHTLKIGEIMEWNPRPEDGSWEYYTKFLEHVPGSKPTQFKAKAAGTTTLRYVTPTKTHTIEVTIAGTAQQIGITGLPENFSVGTNEVFAFDPVPSDGVWEFLPGTLEHIDGSSPTAFKALKVGPTTLAYITKEGMRCHIEIDVKDHPVLAAKPAEAVEVSSQAATSSQAAAQQSSSQATSSSSSSSTTSVKSAEGTKVADLPKTYKMKVGETVTWNPIPNDGSWTYNSEYLTYISGSNPASFKAVKEGTFVVKYKISSGEEYSINVTVTK